MAALDVQDAVCAFAREIQGVRTRESIEVTARPELVQRSIPFGAREEFTASARQK